jgi:hypothetical protein
VIKQLAATLYSNKAIFSLNQMRGWLLFLLFIVNVLMLSAPLIQARADITGPQILDRFDGLEEALLQSMVDSDCVLGAPMVCSTSTVQTINGYEIAFLSSVTSTTYVLFDANQVIVQTPNDFFIGGYEYASGVALASITSSTALEGLMYGFATSGATFDFSLIVFGQLIQTMLYLFTISLMLLVSNYRAKVKKITFSQALRVTIIAMIGPALISGFVGFIEVTLAGIVFITLYSLRMMYVYLALFSKPKENSSQ